MWSYSNQFLDPEVINVGGEAFTTQKTVIHFFLLPFLGNRGGRNGRTTMTEGQSKKRLNECCGINSSLLALKKCIRGLVQNSNFFFCTPLQGHFFFCWPHCSLQCWYFFHKSYQEKVLNLLSSKFCKKKIEGLRIES